MGLGVHWGQRSSYCISYTTRINLRQRKQVMRNVWRWVLAMAIAMKATLPGESRLFRSSTFSSFWWVRFCPFEFLKDGFLVLQKKGGFSYLEFLLCNLHLLNIYIYVCVRVHANLFFLIGNCYTFILSPHDRPTCFKMWIR